MDPVELCVLVAFGLMSVWVLALGAWWTVTQGRVWTGVNGVYVQDVTQYLAWIQDASRHVLVSDLFVLRATPHHYLQPAIVVSGELVAIGVAPWLALALWQPVAVGGVALVARALVRHELRGRLARRVALALALFGGAIGTFQDLWLPWWTWGYVFGVLSLAAMVGSLLLYERATERRASVWPATVLAGLAAWLHPWQGVLLVVIFAGAALVAGDEARPTWRLRALLPTAPVLIAISLPLGYYAVLYWSDPAWRLSERSLAGGLPPWQVLLMLAPLLVPAVLAYRVRSRSFVSAAVRVWPPAAFAVYLATWYGLGNEPLHSCLGISIPLAILAAQGIATVRWPARAPRRALATAAVISMTVPQGVSEFAGKWRYVRPSANWPTRSDWRAVGYLERDRQPGGVLAGFVLGRYIPAETGRRTYIGDVFWSEPDPQTRERTISRLLAGRMTPAQAQSFVSRTGARFLLSDCTVHANLERDLAPIIRAVRRFGCATVYELAPASDRHR